MVPREGIEPPTLRSSGERSTNELPRHYFWSGWRESNPRRKLPRPPRYHYATSCLCVWLYPQAQTGDLAAKRRSSQYRECVLLGRLGSNQRLLGLRLTAGHITTLSRPSKTHFNLDHPLGFEPRFSDSKSDVLPLDEG